MAERDPTRTRVDRRLVGEPIPVGERTIQPVAQVSGWYGSGRSETGSGAGAWVRITPVEVIVREGDGDEYSVPITDGTREALRGIFFAALLVPILFGLVTLITAFKNGRRSKNL
jgi:hypothetical protein